jgi:DNA phosphorothioation-associated putative methyltransferase
MSEVPIQRHKTALRRGDLSRPVYLALEHSLITEETRVFDYGCGRGGDLRRLQKRGIICEGWDPVFRPEGERQPADVVNLGFVVNVIEDPQERVHALRDAWRLTERVLIVSARLTTEARADDWSPCGDGYVTQRDTFQKFYEQQELRTWIDQTLGTSSLAAAPGIFFVFRDSGLAQSYLASTFRTRARLPRVRQVESLYEEYQETLSPLVEFFADRGRLPKDWELSTAAEIRDKLGSLKRAFSVIQHATGREQWEQITEERSQDLLVYLALSRFGGRPSFSALSEKMQLDVRALFGSYRRACAKADDLLFSIGQQDLVSQECQTASVGKCTHEALYIHIDALADLPPLLRVYEGCARAYVGSVEGANILKLHHQKPQVSYLSYPNFETDPHPALRESLKVRFTGLQIEYRDYRENQNPFILHRKEAFLPPDHPLRPKFERLTKQEEAGGLFENSRIIGTRDGWNEVLAGHGLRLRGHRLIVRNSTDRG